MCAPRRSPLACCAAQQAEAGGDGGQSDEAGRGHHPAACAGAAALRMELGEWARRLVLGAGGVWCLVLGTEEGERTDEGETKG